MTQFANKSFSSRPATKEYRNNYDATFGVIRCGMIDGSPQYEKPCTEIAVGDSEDGVPCCPRHATGMREELFRVDIYAKDGETWLCQACGRKEKRKSDFKEHSCQTWAVFVPAQR